MSNRYVYGFLFFFLLISFFPCVCVSVCAFHRSNCVHFMRLRCSEANSVYVCVRYVVHESRSTKFYTIAWKDNEIDTLWYNIEMVIFIWRHKSAFEHFVEFEIKLFANTWATYAKISLVKPCPNLVVNSNSQSLLEYAQWLIFLSFLYTYAFVLTQLVKLLLARVHVSSLLLDIKWFTELHSHKRAHTHTCASIYFLGMALSLSQLLFSNLYITNSTRSFTIDKFKEIALDV